MRCAGSSSASRFPEIAARGFACYRLVFVTWENRSIDARSEETDNVQALRTDAYETRFQSAYYSRSFPIALSKSLYPRFNMYANRAERERDRYQRSGFDGTANPRLSTRRRM